MKTVFLSSLILLSHSVMSQAGAGILTGKITDKNNEPIFWANVTIKSQNDSISYNVDLTDSATFEFNELPDGVYNVQVSAEGYEPYSSPSFKLSTYLHMHSIQLKEQADLMDEVVVAARKNAVDIGAGKTVLNLDQSITGAGSSIFEVLKTAPNVSVDMNDRIIIKGNQTAAIFIDGKPALVSGEDLANLLKSMPADAVDKLEIITHAGASQDAATAGGVINIKTKRGKYQGWNGNAVVNFGQGKYEKYGAGFNLNYKKDRFSLYSNYAYSFKYFYNHLVLDRSFLSTDASDYGRQLFKYNQDNFALYDINNHMVTLGGDYKLTEATSIGFGANFNSNMMHPSINSSSEALDGNNKVLYQYATKGRHKNNMSNYGYNANFSHQFNDAGQSITMDVDYARFDSQTDQMFATHYTPVDKAIVMDDYLLRSDMSGYTDIAAIKADYMQPFGGKHRLALGVKLSKAVSDNNPQFFEWKNNEYELDSKRSNHFIYNEYIYAAYASTNINHNKWKHDIGLRWEYTQALWEQKAYQSKFKNAYHNLFPSVSSEYSITDKHQMALQLSRTIERPNYQQLNPFKYFVDKTTYREGNPYLQPSYYNSLQLTHIFNHNFRSTLGYGVSKNYIAGIMQPSEVEDSVTVQTSRNLDKMTYVGFTGTYTPRFKKWWYNNTSVEIYQARYTGNLANTPINAGRPTFNVTMSNQFLLPKGFTAELGGQYRHKELYTYLDLRESWALNVGVQKNVLKDRATIKLNIQDIFHRSYPRATTTYAGYLEHFTAERETRIANISFSYRFGNQANAIRKRASGAEEEIRRAAQSGQ
jgi:hypothetical protein